MMAPLGIGGFVAGMASGNADPSQTKPLRARKLNASTLMDLLMFASTPLYSMPNPSPTDPAPAIQAAEDKRARKNAKRARNWERDEFCRSWLASWLYAPRNTTEEEAAIAEDGEAMPIYDSNAAEADAKTNAMYSHEADAAMYAAESDSRAKQGELK